MKLEDFKKLVETKKSSNPIWFALDVDMKPDDSNILKAEEELKVKLPLEYIEFIREYGGGYFALSNIFSLDDTSDWNIIKKNHNYSILRQGHILVSDNGAGDFYGFKVINGICLAAIYFFDHETASWSKTNYSNLFEYLERFALTN